MPALLRQLSIVGFLAFQCCLFSSQSHATQDLRGPPIVQSVNGKVISVPNLRRLIDEEIGDFHKLDYIIETPPIHIKQLSWVLSTCTFTSDPIWRNKYGPYPERSWTRMQRHRRFELRLCVRRLRNSIDHNYLQSINSEITEQLIIDDAERCGYVTGSTFPAFAFAQLTMGREIVLGDARFLCSKQLKPKLLKGIIDGYFWYDAASFMYYLDILGTRESAKKYLFFRNEVLKNRKEIILELLRERTHAP